MMKWIVWLLPLALILAACGADETAATLPPTEVVSEVEAQPTQEAADSSAPSTQEPPPAPADPTAVPEPATPTAIPTSTPPAEPAVTATVEVEPPPTAEAVVNGQYENTYFRGSESAPVTLVDYSDFL